jgi:hypothetical protein
MKELERELDEEILSDEVEDEIVDTGKDTNSVDELMQLLHFMTKDIPDEESGFTVSKELQQQLLSALKEQYLTFKDVPSAVIVQAVFIPLKTLGYRVEECVVNDFTDELELMFGMME